MQRDDFNWLVRELRGLSSDLGSLAGHAGEPLVLAIDQGGHASRAIVFDRSGREVAQAFAPISTYRAGADRVEHSPLEILESIRLAIADVCRSLGTDAARITAAGLATQRSSIVCWDKRTLAPLSPVLSWQDRRNAAWLEGWRSHAARVKDLTGLPLSPHYGVSKLRWCLDEVPAVREAASRGQLAFGPLASWLLAHLAGTYPFVVDPANASRTLLFDITRGDWSPELLELAGMTLQQLPKIVNSRHAYGNLDLAGQLVPLVVCTGDQSAVPFAHGLPDGHTLYLNVGTGAFLQYPLPSADCPTTSLLRGVLWWDPAGPGYALEGTVNGAGSALDWLGGETGLDDHRAARSMTRETVAGLDIPVFINGVSGVGSPYFLPHLESRFLSAGSGDIERVAAVLESIAFLIAANVTEIRLVAPAPERILAGGGLSLSEYLLSCVADLTGLVVERSSLREATATGLAFKVAEQPAGWHPEAETTQYRPAANPALQVRHERWREAMQIAAAAHRTSR